ncbi:hypothetical protein [uncultured Algibacter sp.]|uniref:hypothetical protein n=1 Tax=uncultured Algibacter sp. TaxID=298659 RepID=UPI00263227E2|nr:hypothetical protein [uncultured Algibacter sp.]
MLDYKLLDKISKEVGNSFYILNESNYLKNITDLKNAFLKFHDKIIIGYSYKTNYIPKLCRLAKENGVYAEVVSDMELDLAFKLGYKPEKIIFNGPLKKEKDLEKVLLGNGIVNIDSFHEVNLLKKIVTRNAEAKISVGLRINMSLIDENGNSTIQEGLKYGRFGFEDSDENLGKAIEIIRGLGVTINALHGHTSSSDRSLKNFGSIAKTLCRVRNKYNLNDIAYFNVGGGFFGPMPKGLLNRKTPAFEEYADTIFSVFNDDEWFANNKPYIILEPGVSVVSNALSYFAKVMDIKKIRSKNFLLIEGGIYNVKPTMHRLNLPFKVFSKSIKNTSLKFDVVGSTCMEKDVVLSEVEISGVSVSDYISIENVGAYTVVKTPEFINYIPAIVSIEKNEISIVRYKQNLSNVLQQYNLNA